MLIIDLQVTEWLHTSIIVLTPPDSPWNSPLTIVEMRSLEISVVSWWASSLVVPLWIIEEHHWIYMIKEPICAIQCRNGPPYKVNDK
ncbi:hypothetical protein QOT17_008181 [Balamuthia mandrillaris]